MKVKIPDKDFQNIKELKELVPIIEDLNKTLEKIVVYRSHKHRETFESNVGVSIEKKFLQLEFTRCITSATRSQSLPRTIEIETDPEKMKKSMEEFTTNYLIWKKRYLKKEKKGKDAEK